MWIKKGARPANSMDNSQNRKEEKAKAKSNKWLKVLVKNDKFHKTLFRTDSKNHKLLQ